MSGSDQQIVTSYEELGMTVEEIASDTGWDTLSIKAVLLQNSSIFRATNSSSIENQEAPSLEAFDSRDNKEALMVMRELMHIEDDPHLRYKAAKYVRDDAKGRLDPVKMIKDIKTITVHQFNISLSKAREARNRTKNKIIDISNDSQQITSNSSKAAV